MSNYKYRVESYSTFKKGKEKKMWRVVYAYKTPDGVYRTSCKRGFEKQHEGTAWAQTELLKVIAEKEQDKPLAPPAPVVVIPAMETLESNLLDAMTMDELIAEYIELRVSSRKPSTQVTKLNIINQKILPYFSGKKVIDIKAVDVERWQKIINEMETKEGYGLSNTYKYTIRGQLVAIMNYAVQIHDLPSNPVLKTQRIGKKKASKQPFWELSEYAKFRKVAAEKPQYFYFWELLYWTGMRSGEAKSICLKDILWDKKVIRVYKTLSNANLPTPSVKPSKKEAKKLQEGETDPKADSSYRDIHLPQILVDELKEYVDSLYGLTPNDYLFNLSKSGSHRELDRCIEATGVTDITIHGFRHSANALLSNVVRCPDVVRKYRLGHSDETTNDIYNHPYKYGLEEVATKLNELMEEIDNVSEELGF